MPRPFLRTTALSALLCSGLSTAGLAQSYETGGIQLSFGLGLGAEVQSNRTLSVGDPGTSAEIGADLTFGLLTETRSQRFLFEAGGRIRTLDAPAGTSAEGNGFVRPSLRLEYSREAAAGRLQFRARLSETDVSEVETLEVDSIDLVIASGTATRRSAFVEGRIDWRRDRPFGFGILARISDVEYRDGIATGIGGTNLLDNRRLTLGINTRFDLSPVARLTNDLSFDSFEEDGTPGQRETISLRNTLTLDRPLGALTLGLNLDHTEQGERVSARVGRSYEMPWGTLNGALGLTRGVAGAQLFCLFHHLGGVIEIERSGAHRLQPVASNHNRAGGINCSGRSHRMFQQRGLCNRVKDLGQVRFHPGAFACGKDDKRGFHVFLVLLSLHSLYPLRTKAQGLGPSKMVAGCNMHGRGTAQGRV